MAKPDVGKILHTGAHIAAETVTSEAKSWFGKLFGIGLGFFTGGAFGDSLSNFSTTDEHESHDGANLLEPDEREILIWFYHKAFPELGDVAADRFINYYQNRFRAYAVKRGRREADKPHDDNLTAKFLRDEIVTPIKTASTREIGFKKVIRNLSALDIPLPPGFTNERFLRKHARDLEHRFPERTKQPRSRWDRMFRL